MPDVHVVQFTKSRGELHHERFPRLGSEKWSLSGEETGRAVPLFAVQLYVDLGGGTGVGLGPSHYTH